MNGLTKKGLLTLGVLSLAVFVVMFTTAAHAASVSQSNATPSQAAACTTTSGAAGAAEVVQQGDCQGQFGDQTTPDSGVTGESSSAED